MKYDLALPQVIKHINEQQAKTVCIQLADGLKQYAVTIQEEIEDKTDAQVLLWVNSCYGACDVPDLSKVRPAIDLVVQFGHEVFIKTF